MWQLQQGVYRPSGAFDPQPVVAGTWTPANLATGSRLWLDFSDVATVTTSAGEITQVNDKSTYATNATPDFSYTRPAYATAALNGLNMASFPAWADNRCVEAAASVTSTAMFAFMVCIPASGAGTNGRFASFGVSGAADYNSVGRLAWVAPSSGNARGTRNSTDTPNAAYTQDAANLVAVAYDGTVGSCWTNGVQGSTVSSTGSFAVSAIRVGCHTNGNDGFQGKIGEFIVLDYAPGSTDRQKIEGYLAWKWGLQASLPGGHPYLSAAP